MLCGDCREILAALPERCADHVITDPPYDEATHEKARSLKGGGSDIDIDFQTLDVQRVGPLLLRPARRWVIAFCSLEMLGAYRRAWAKAGIRSGVWDRPDGTPQLSGDRPAQGAEGIAIAHGPGRKRWNSGGKRGTWRCGIERVERHGHPTPKPLALMLELIEDFTEPEDIVLDPFCGSGTTLVAAVRLGRRAIGIDLDPRYARLTRERMMAEQTGISLTAARAGQVSLFGAGT